MASVRRNYGVPAHRGAVVTFRGYTMPIDGHIISSTGSHLYMRRLDTGRRFGPLHPTWKMNYGDGRDYSSECDAIGEVQNDWLNGRCTNDEYRARVRQIREEAIRAAA